MLFLQQQLRAALPLHQNARMLDIPHAELLAC